LNDERHMFHPRIPLRDARDIAAIEQRPLAAYGGASCSYELLLDAAERFPRKAALKFFFDGECFDPRRIPLRARVRALAAWLRYGEPVARPFEVLGFGEAAAQVARIARLFGTLGVGRADVVSLLLPNFPETMLCMWAAETVGVLNPVNPLLEPDILRAILVAARTKVLVTVGELPGSDIWSKVQRIRADVPTLEAVIVVRGSAPPDCLRLRAATAGKDDSPLPRKAWPTAGDIATLFHTGGTTGLPKLVRGTHGNKIANAQMLVLAAPLTHDDVGLIALPMFHVNAAINALIGLRLGMTSVIAGPAGFRTQGVRENFLRILAAQRISYFSAVPSIFAALLDQPGGGEDLRSVRFAISAAAALPVEVMRAFTAKTGIRILEGYGQTEATVASCLNPFDGASKPGSVGLPLPFVQLKCVILDGRRHLRDCEPGEIGRLLVAGEHVSVGYLNPEHDSDLWVNDAQGQRWLDSGDLARIDSDGYVWLTGRAKELIIRGGHNIDPRMIEEALQSHPAVLMAAAVGQPDPQSGEVPVVYATLAAGANASPEELLQHAREHIPERAAWPKAIRIVEELPLTAIGKVYKPRLLQWEHETAFRAALRALDPWVDAVDVDVQQHAEHGLYALVSLRPKPATDCAALREQATAILGRFATRHRLAGLADEHEEAAESS
jgi:fatty-acyl-CoA synthase